MNTIIVGVDFSKGSTYALGLAVDVANRCGYDVELVWVEQSKKRQVEGEDVPEGAIKEQMDQLVKEYAPKLKSGNMCCVCRKGKVPHELAEEAKEREAEMIVMGTNGGSGFKKKSMGSNAYKTIQEAKCPVLTVRQDFDYHKKLDRIVLPLDSSDATRQKVPFAANMAKLFGSEVYIVGLYTSKVKNIRNSVNRYVTQAKEFFVKEGVPYQTCFLEAENITTTTIRYAQEVNADLIVIMSEQEKAFTNLFTGSYTQQLLHTSPFPIMSVHPEEINRESR